MSNRWHEENRERSRELNRQYRRKHPNKFHFWSVRGRSRRLGIPFELKFEDVHWPTHCPVLGIELDYAIGDKDIKPKPNSPSIDRVDPGLGYVPGNAHVISFRANSLKRDATLDEMLRIVEYMKANT